MYAQGGSTVQFIIPYMVLRLECDQEGTVVLVLALQGVRTVTRSNGKTAGNNQKKINRKADEMPGDKFWTWRAETQLYLTLAL